MFLAENIKIGQVETALSCVLNDLCRTRGALPTKVRVPSGSVYFLSA